MDENNPGELLNLVNSATFGFSGPSDVCTFAQ